MKSIQDLGLRFEYGRNYRWGLFLCAFCNSEVQRNNSAGIKAKSCGCARLKITADSNRKDVRSVIREAKQVHGNKYTYGNVYYVTMQTKISVTCLTHGDFMVTPGNHIANRHGCPSCYRENSRSTLEEFLGKARNIHGDTFGYGNTQYYDQKTKCTITCKRHGDFTITPQAHLQNVGCPTCGEYNKRRKYINEPTILYYLRIGDVYKLGITLARRGVLKRMSAEKVDYEILLLREFTDGHDAYYLEQQILSECTYYKYSGPPILAVGGNSELLTYDIMQIPSVWDMYTK